MTYSNIGPVRGHCGHNHRTLMGAIRCLKADQRGCRSQGGYSDRKIKLTKDGNERDLDESDLGAAERHALFGTD